MRNEQIIAQITGVKMTESLFTSNEEKRNDDMYHISCRILFKDDTSESGVVSEKVTAIVSNLDKRLQKRLKRAENNSNDKWCLEFADLLLDENELKECGFSYDVAPTKEVQIAVVKKAASILRDENGEFIKYVFSIADCEATELLKKAGRSKGMRDDYSTYEFNSFYSTDKRRAYPYIYAARLGARSKEYMSRRLARQIDKALQKFADGTYTPGNVEADNADYLRYVKASKANGDGKESKSVKIRESNADVDDLDF